MAPKFKRTYTAAQVELESEWELLEAIAADAVDADVAIVSAESISEAQAALLAAGRDLAASTVKSYCMVARFDHSSTTAQRKVFRRYARTSILEFVKAGWSQEAAYDFLAGSLKRRKAIEEAVRPGAGGAPARSNDPELWDDDQWDAFDADVVKAAALVIRAFNLIQRGYYEPSIEALAQLTLLREPDIDKELAALLEAE